MEQEDNTNQKLIGGLIVAALLILAVAFLTSCSSGIEESHQEVEEIPTRIHRVENTFGGAMTIWEVDGVEYLVRRDGGIIKLDK